MFPVHMPNYYELCSSMPYTPTIPPPTSVTHYYHSQPAAYPTFLHRQITIPIPHQPFVTLATVTTTQHYYPPVPPTLTPPTLPTPSTTLQTPPTPPTPPTVAPPLLTPTHQDAWEAKMAAQHSEIMRLLRLRFGIPEPQPPPPTPILPPTSFPQTLTPPPPPPATLQTPPSSPVTFKPLPSPAATITTLPPVSRSPQLSKPPPLPATVQPPPPFPRPTTTTPPMHSPVIASKLLFEEFGFPMSTSSQPPSLSGPYDISLFGIGPSGYRIWNPGGKHAQVDGVVSFPHLEDKVALKGRVLI